MKVMEEIDYRIWPLGHIPERLQRPELRQLEKEGYSYKDAREAVTMFENKVAAFAGSKYAVAVDCCTHALELSLRYWRSLGNTPHDNMIEIPRHTYISVPQMIKRVGFNVQFVRDRWQGIYWLRDTQVIDAAVRWQEGMYVPNSYYCLSFQIKKTIPIGRGGMILTDDADAAEWCRLKSYDGRDLTLPYDHPDHVKMSGYHYYMTPEDAARGILLMDKIDFRGDSAGWENYPDVRKMMKL
jgi:dTDP-4-amino-4,6-dideoxygalactose transaminase